MCCRSPCAAQDLLINKSDAGVHALLEAYKNQYCLKWLPVQSLSGKAGAEAWRDAVDTGDIVCTGQAIATKRKRKRALTGKEKADATAAAAARKLPKLPASNGTGTGQQSPPPTQNQRPSADLSNASGEPVAASRAASDDGANADDMAARMPQWAAAEAARQLSIPSIAIADGPAFQRSVSTFLSSRFIEINIRKTDQPICLLLPSAYHFLFVGSNIAFRNMLCLFCLNDSH